MSTSYDIFLKYDQPVETLVPQLERIVGTSLQHSSETKREYYSAVVLGVGIDLTSPVDFHDDVITYSSYDFQIMVEYKGLFDSGYQPDLLPILTIVLANQIFRTIKCECIALADLTQILAEFKT